MLLSTKPGVQKSAAWILGQVWLQLEGTATDAEGTGGSPNRAWGLGKDPPPLQVPIQIDHLFGFRVAQILMHNTHITDLKRYLLQLILAVTFQIPFIA